MKSKILAFVFMTIIMSSCSDEEEEFNFVGVWYLQSYIVSNTDFGSNQYNLNETIIADENCLYESTLTVYPNNIAVIKLTSTITNTLQIVEGTADEVEQVVTCENEEQEIILNWATGDYSEINDDGSVFVSSSGGYNTIRFIDNNGEVVMGGFVGFDNNLNMNLSNSSNNRIFLDVDGEEVEFLNLVFAIFNRAL